MLVVLLDISGFSSEPAYGIALWCGKRFGGDATIGERAVRLARRYGPAFARVLALDSAKIASKNPQAVERLLKFIRSSR